MRGVPEEGKLCPVGVAKIEGLKTTAEIAQLLSAKHRTVLVWVREKNMPCHRVPGTSGKGVSYRFRWSDVLEWLEKQGGSENHDNDS